MPDRSTAQMILEVDARIATAQRAVNQLARSIQQDAAGMDGSLKKIEDSSQRVSRSLGAINDNGRVRAGFTQLSFQIGDVTQQLSLGVSASRIFAQQSGQVIQALQVMGGQGNKFLQFLGGPWGIAISTAAVILAPLASKLFETGDEVGKLVDKMREQARQAALNREADEIWKHTIEGLTDAIRKRREEQEKARKSDVTAEQESLAAAQGELGGQAKNLEAKANELRAAVADLRQARAYFQSVAGTDLSAPALKAVVDAENKVKSLSGQVRDITNSVRSATLNLRGEQAKILQRQAEQAVDPLKKTSDDIAYQIDQLTEKFTKGQIGPAAYRKEIEKLTKALKDAKDAGKSTSSGLSGNQIDFAQAAKIAKSAGLQVNSGYRSPAAQAALYNNPAVNRPGNPVAPPGASAHNGANGKWALDIQITDGVTPAKIRKIYADQGVSLTKVLKEKGHFHIEGSRSEAAKAENEAQRQAEIQLRNDNAFAEQKDRLNQELLRAQADLLQGINEQADAAEAAVLAEQARRDNAIQNDVSEKKLTQAQADQLKAINDSIAKEKIKSIEIGRQVDLIKQQDERQQRTFEYQVDDLRFADEMAKTQAEHRRLQLEILDIVYQEKQAHLENLKSIALTNGDQDKANQLQDQIDRLPTDKAQDQERTRRGTMNPLEAWAQSVPQTADQINEALQSIQARGLENLSSAISDVITGTKSLSEAFSDVAKSIIADIIQMTVKMLVFRAISSVVGSAFGGASGGGMNFDQAMSGNAFTFTGGELPGFATGGSFMVGGRGGTDNNILSINGMPRAKVSANERIVVVPRAPNISLGGSSGVQQQVPQRVIIDLRSDMLHAQIAEGANVQIARTYPAMKADTMKAVSEQRRRA